MTNVILAVLGVVTLFLYVLKRRARLKAEDNDTY